MNNPVIRALSLIIHVLLNVFIVGFITTYDITGSWISFILFTLTSIVLLLLMILHILSFMLFIKSRFI